jgi:hypothetical protein
MSDTPNVITLYAGSHDEMMHRAADFQSRGFVIQSQDQTHAVLIKKKKELNVALAIVLGFFCIIPLIIYLVQYTQQKDEVVYIYVGSPGPSPGASPPFIPSNPTQPYWDGTRWIVPGEQ